MKNRYVKMVIAMVLVLCMVLGMKPMDASAATTYTPEQLYEKASPAVVRVETKDSEGSIYIGTGFFIGQSSILTNYHVVEAASEIRLIGLDETEYTISKITNYDTVNDLIIFKVKESNPNYLKFATSAKAGQDVWCIGNPYGLNGSFIDGMISKPGKMMDDVEYIQISMPSGTGIGGAPVLNKYGNVVAVACMVVTSAQCISLCIPYSTCKDFVNGKIGQGKMPLKTLFNKNAGKTKETNFYDISDVDVANVEEPTDVQSLRGSDGVKSSEEIAAIATELMTELMVETSTEGVIGYSRGSGFFVTENSIVTNKHVVDGLSENDPSKIEIVDYAGNTYKAVDVRYSENDLLDSVIITVEVPEGVTHGVAEVNVDYRPIVGERVYSDGSPLGLPGSFARGIVSMSSRRIYGNDYFQVSTPITNGNSGGPVFNRYGEVIGIITMTATVIEKTNFAINIGLLSSLIEADREAKGL